jgi:hypothetical protein
LSFTVIATPVNHGYTAPCLYPIATPRAIPYDHDYNKISHRSLITSYMSYQDDICAFGDWFENAGFNVKFRITPLRLAIAAFAFGWMQLTSMILFGDYTLALKFVKCLFRGFCSVSISHPLLFPLRVFTN